VRFEQKTKKKGEVGEWAKGKEKKNRESINFVIFIKFVNSMELIEFN